MKHKGSIKNKNSIVENLVSRKVLGLLIKKEMSISDLAKEIYGKANVRSGITKSVDELLRRGIIIRKDTNRITGQKRFYRIDWDVLGDFDKEEKKFIKLFIERFWNPKVTDPVISINELLLEALFIKKIYKVKEENILDYYPKKDLEDYSKNNDKFWNEEKFRDNFLDKLLKMGEKKFNKKGFSGLYIKRDFIFLSTLIPETIFDKLPPEYRSIGSPIYTAVAILDSYNKEKRYECSKCSHQFNELFNKCPNCETELQVK